jgi:hypothetical protein
MNKVKEVKVNPKWPLVCENDDCHYRKECSNHQSAGDFRTDGGIQPKLVYVRGVLHCETYYWEPMDDPDRYDFPKRHYESGFCTDPVEIVDDYQL